jgi:hypothetical protein
MRIEPTFAEVRRALLLDLAHWSALAADARRCRLPGLYHRRRQRVRRLSRELAELDNHTARNRPHDSRPTLPQ